MVLFVPLRASVSSRHIHQCCVTNVSGYPTALAVQPSSRMMRVSGSVVYSYSIPSQSRMICVSSPLLSSWQFERVSTTNFHPSIALWMKSRLLYSNKPIRNFKTGTRHGIRLSPRSMKMQVSHDLWLGCRYRSAASSLLPSKPANPTLAY